MANLLGNMSAMTDLDEYYITKDGQTNKLTLGTRLTDSIVGLNSVAIGTNIVASGANSHGIGTDVSALGENSFAIGTKTTAIGLNAYAAGTQCIVTTNTIDKDKKIIKRAGKYFDLSAIGVNSYANGYGVIAEGNYSHAEGASYGTATLVDNGNTTSSYVLYPENTHLLCAASEASHAEGKGSVASGIASHAEGSTTKTDANYAHAEGYMTSALGVASHAEGYMTTAKYDYSHAGGCWCETTNHRSYVWNGDNETYSQTNPYKSKFAGSFCINPRLGASGFYIGEDTLSGLISINTGNTLKNKKYVALGDSFTKRGDSATFKYYPDIIGTRNLMNCINYGESDLTLRNDPNDSINQTKRHLLADKWTEIVNDVTDADYITIMIGINDMATSLPSGITYGELTSDSAATVYGSWNTLLSAIFEVNNIAKIGIITQDYSTITEQYTTAVKEIGKWWGIPVLDIRSDPNIPIGISGKTYEINPYALARRNSAFKITNTDYHPSQLAHYYRSTIIENFMRSL